MKKDKSELEFLYAGDIWSAFWGEECSKHIGKAITHSLKEIFKGNEISLFSTKVG